MEVRSFLTSALGGGTWSASRPSCFNLLAQEPKVTTEKKERWVPELSWRPWRRGKCLASAGNRTTKSRPSSP